MASGSTATFEVPQDELCDNGKDFTHLACGCRPALTHCGKYQPGITGVDLVQSADNLCGACLKVWENMGCGACPCGPWRICGACIRSAADCP